jgi:hypothetical protein
MPMSAPIHRSGDHVSRGAFACLLALAVVLAGCAGSSTTVEGSDAALRAVHPKDEVLITFRDGGTVRAKPYDHRWTDSVGAYQVRGTRRLHAKSRSTESYSGWITAAVVDSIHTMGSAATPVNVLYLSDGSLIYAAPSEMVELPPHPSPGFWCTGEYLRAGDDGTFGSDSTFTGMIDPANVRSVEMNDRELRTSSLVLQGLGMIAAIPLLYWAGAFLVWAWNH